MGFREHRFVRAYVFYEPILGKEYEHISHGVSWLPSKVGEVGDRVVFAPDHCCP